MPDGDDIRHALDLAIAEATSAGSEAVEPLHVLIGVLRLGDGVVDQAVAACGIDPVRLRRHLRGYARRTVRPTAGGPLRVSRRAERVLERAERGGTRSPASAIACALLDPIDAGISNALRIEGIDPGLLLRALAPGRTLQRGRTALVGGRSTTRRTMRLEVAELEAALRRRVVGQDHAVATVASVVAPALASAKRKNRTRAALLFVGAGDVGRSSVARALAAHLHGDPRRLVRARAGSPTWVNDLAAELAAMPRSVVYVADIEAMRPEERAIVASMLVDGCIHRESGASVSLEDAIVAIGTRVSCDAGGSMSPGDVRRRLVAEVGEDLVSAVDRIVLFQQLAVADIREIAAEWLDAAAKSARVRDGIDVTVQPDAVDALAEIGIRPGEGPCAMRRAVEHSVVQPLRDALASGALRRGDALRIVEGPLGPMLADALPGSIVGGDAK
ncbi:MAG: hypothetical protein IPF53_01485 [Blastocatellia bacterium]|nr:hypothetical protein [Blastocatellia bacterium]